MGKRNTTVSDAETVRGEIFDLRTTAKALDDALDCAVHVCY